MADIALVSVVMAARNAEATLESSLSSVLAQTLRDVEVIVVDDGSTDGTGAILRRAAAEDGRITVITTEARGLTPSLTRAISSARGTYLARQDADDESLPQRLEQQVAWLREHDTLAAVGTAAAVIDACGRQTGTFPMQHGSAAVRADLRAMRSTPVHGSILMRRDRYDDVGGYREAFQASQDFDLWLRLTERFEMDNLPDTLYRWRLHPGGVYRTRRRVQLRYSGVALAFAGERAAGGRDSYGVLEVCRGDLDAFASRFRDRGRLEAIWGELVYKGLNDPVSARTHLTAAIRLGDVRPRTLALWALSLTGLSWPGGGPLGPGGWNT